MKESFSTEQHLLSEEQRLWKQDQQTWMSQLENHKVLLNDLDSILEKINLDLTHKFSLTIKGLQEEKVDKNEFVSKLAFIDKQVAKFYDDTKLMKESEERIRKNLYKLIHANTQIEFYELMNIVFKEESDEKENMRIYLSSKFQNITKTKKVNRTITVKRKIWKPKRTDSNDSRSKISVQNESCHDGFTANERYKSEDSDKSEYVEELKQEEVDKEMDLIEITDQIWRKFNDIKESIFSQSQDKNK